MTNLLYIHIRANRTHAPRTFFLIRFEHEPSSPSPPRRAAAAPRCRERICKANSRVSAYSSSICACAQTHTQTHTRTRITNCRSLIISTDTRICIWIQINTKQKKNTNMFVIIYHQQQRNGRRGTQSFYKQINLSAFSAASEKSYTKSYTNGILRVNACARVCVNIE